MGSPFSFANMYGGEEEDPYASSRKLKNPYSAWAEGDIGQEAGDLLPPSTRNMLEYEETPPLEEEDPAAKMYMENASQPMPSEGLLKDYLNRRPDESGENKPKWYERLVAGLSMLGGRESARAGQDYLHRRYNRAYDSWATEGKLVPQMARSADAARSKELEAERFNIIGTAKKRQFDEAKRKTSAIETGKEEAAKAKEAKDLGAEARRVKTDERLEAGALRAEGNANRAERREQRMEERDIKKEAKEVDTSRHSSYERRKRDFESSIDNIEVDVVEEFQQKYPTYFVPDPKGKELIPNEQGLAAGIVQMKDAEVKKRKRKAEDDFDNSLVEAGITHKLGE